MKHLLAAAAISPLLIACASAGAQTTGAAASQVEESQTRVLIVNGQRIELADGDNAATAIEQALEEAGGRQRIRLELRRDGEDWSAEQREAFAAAMARLGERFGEDFADSFSFEFDGDFDFDFEGDRFNGDDVRIYVERIERQAERNAEQAEAHAERAMREAERAAARAERQAMAAERFGERMAVQGLRAGARGMEAGIAGIDRVLERGWYRDNGERVTLDDEKRAELEESRRDLADDLVDLRAELAEVEDRLGVQSSRREVRIERHNGQVRAWVNGEEVRGEALDELLEGAPEAPEPPQAPDAP